MKRLFITLLLIALLAAPAFAKEYRVKADFLLLNEDHAIFLYNFFEEHKAHIYQPTGNEDYAIPTYVCFIDSWDTETPAKPGFTRRCIDWEASSQVWTPADNSIGTLQAIVNEWQIKINVKQADLDAKNAALQIKKDELQALIDAQE